MEYYLKIMSLANILSSTFSIVSIAILMIYFRENIHGMQITIVFGSALCVIGAVVYFLSAQGSISNTSISFYGRPLIFMLLGFPGLVAVSQIIWAKRKKG